MRIDPMRDLDLMDRPLDYSTDGFAEAAAVREDYNATVADLRRNVRPGSPMWTAKTDAAKGPVSKRAAWLDGEAARALEAATGLAEARLKSLSRPPKDPVDDAQLARLRDGLAKVDPAQRSGQFLHSAQEYADGRNAPAHETLLRAIFTAPVIWGAEPLVDEAALKRAEAVILLPEIGGLVWRAKLATRLAEGLRQTIGEVPPPRFLSRPGRDNATP